MDGVDPCRSRQQSRSRGSFWAVPALLTMAVLGVCMTIQPVIVIEEGAVQETSGGCLNPPDTPDAELGFRHDVLLRSLPAALDEPKRG